jgi:type II secretory pathway pseudopilin PulG
MLHKIRYNTKVMLNKQRRSTANLRHNEDGFASLVIALTLIVIMALITTGFAQLSSREQQDALNNQLATQAEYAAESGINEADAQVQLEAASGVSAIELKGTCPAYGYKQPLNTDNVANHKYLENNFVGSDVTWTCVLINPTPVNLVYSDVSAGGQNVSFLSGTGKTFGSLTVNWRSHDKDNDSSSTFLNSYDPNGSDFESAADWTYGPVLQFSVTDTSVLSRTALDNSTYTNYLLPYNSADTPAPPNSTVQASDDVEKVGSCTPTADATAYACSATITGLDSTSYLLHFNDFYDAADISISGIAQDGTSETFSGGQAIIDATGEAQDVLKRLQVRVPITSNDTLPTQSLQVGNLCKRFTSMPGSSVADTYGADGANDPCSLPD